VRRDGHKRNVAEDSGVKDGDGVRGRLSSKVSPASTWLLVQGGEGGF